MAIQIPNLGSGNGLTGDNELVIRQKYNANFTDQTNAASRLVGTASGQIPLAQEVRSAMLGRIDGDKTTTPNDFVDGTAWYVSSGAPNTPQGFSASRFIIETRSNGSGKSYQRAYGWNTLDAAHRILTGGVWSEWQPIGWNKKHYNTTTAAGANVVVTATGELQRSTSITYSTLNTTKDSNGFLKGASPVVDLYNDSIEQNADALKQSITFEKVSTGNYLVKGSLGFAQEGWDIETPKDANGNVLVAVVYDQLANKDISVKTYAKRFDEDTGDIVANLTRPRDIPTGRFISLRLHEVVDEQTPPAE